MKRSLEIHEGRSATGDNSATGRPSTVTMMRSPVATRSSRARVWFLSSRDATSVMGIECSTSATFVATSGTGNRTFGYDEAKASCRCSRLPVDDTAVDHLIAGACSGTKIRLETET